MTERLTKEQRKLCYISVLAQITQYWNYGVNGLWDYNYDDVEKAMANGVCGFLAYEGADMVGEEEYEFCYWNVDVDFPEFYEQRPEREIDTYKLWWPNTDIESRKTALQNAIKLCK